MQEGTMKKDFNIEGMTCTNCSMKIESALNEQEGVINADVSYGKSLASVTYDAKKIDDEKIHKIVESLGYNIQSAMPSESIAKNQNKAKKYIITGIFIVAVALYFLVDKIVGFNFLPEVNQTMGYGILFVVGLLTSLHCIAMCGGINLSQCVSNKGGSSESFKKKLKPSILYNTGRVISYTIIGGIVGAIGSVLSFSGTAKGIVAIVAGVFMLIMGLNMLNVFPWINKIVPRLPKKLSSKVHRAKKGRGPLIVGLLNGFMPCGPLQTMQLYALGTGSFFAGAFSMLLFSLGTVPLMFAFGAISSILSRKFTKKLMWVSAALVMVLGVIMLGRGLNQSGIPIAVASDDTRNTAQIEDNIQFVYTEMEPNAYEPIAVQVGIPVRWTINVEEGDLNGCNNPITIPKYGVELEMEIGENIIEFTPADEGNVVYTCWMGMISSNIMVVPDITKVSAEDIEREAFEEKQIYLERGSGEDAPIANAQESFEAAVGTCGNNSYSQDFDDGKIPVEEAAVAVISERIQTVSFNVNEYGFSPALIVMQKDVETRLIINGKKLDGCNYSLIFPAYESQLDLVEGENVIEFIPTTDFSFSCWMGMINGYAKVVDDIEKIDMQAIKKEVSEYVSPTGGGCCG